METPNHLKHKPIIKLEEYDELDGPYSNNTDAKSLTIGLAQWNNSKTTDLSAKVWRHTGTNQNDGKWSRQSEELPLHRVIDLASLVCASLHYAEHTSIPMYDKFNITISKNHDLIPLLKEEIKKNKEPLDNSLKRLSKFLKSLGY